LHPFANKRDQQRFDATIEISAMNVQKSHSQSARRYRRRAPALGCANFRAQPNASETIERARLARVPLLAVEVIIVHLKVELPRQFGPSARREARGAEHNSDHDVISSPFLLMSNEPPTMARMLLH
jgi:hypothetical protein